MSKYIKVEDACAEVDRGDLLVGNNAEWAKEIICRTKPADVKEVRFGYWIEAYGDITCSACNASYSDEVRFMNRNYKCEDLPYCPNCGSQMVEVS